MYLSIKCVFTTLSSLQAWGLSLFPERVFFFFFFFLPPSLVKQIENPILSPYLHFVMLTKGTHKEWQLMEIHVDLRRIDLKPFLPHIHHLLGNITRFPCGEVDINKDQHMMEY